MEKKRKETHKIIGDLISSWLLPFVINSITDNADGTYTLLVPKTYYLQVSTNTVLTINSVDYYITDVQDDTSITIKGSVIPPLDTFNLPIPYYFNGTIIQTNLELAQEMDIAKKIPMVYLRRPFSEKLDAEDLKDSFVATEADLTIYFLTESDFAEWATEEHDLHAIQPMRNMMYEFIELLKNNKKIVKRFSDYTATDMIRFGLTTQKGYEGGSLFSDQYSGIQLEITIGFNYQCCD